MVDLDEASLSSPKPYADLNKSMADLEANRAIVEDLVRDLLVETPIEFHDDDEAGDILGTFVGQEFLSAMVVAKGSKLAGKTMEQSGISKLPGVHLFSIERPVADGEGGGGGGDIGNGQGNDDDQVGPPPPPHANGQTRQREARGTVTISLDEVLQNGDILWWSGSGTAIGELRKIPGLVPMEGNQIAKVGRSSDRRLVQAVIARKGPLVGKSIKVRVTTEEGMLEVVPVLRLVVVACSSGSKGAPCRRFVSSVANHPTLLCRSSLAPLLAGNSIQEQVQLRCDCGPQGGDEGEGEPGEHRPPSRRRAPP
jgi:hypothetical protein